MTEEALGIAGLDGMATVGRALQARLDGWPGAVRQALQRKARKAERRNAGEDDYARKALRARHGRRGMARCADPSNDREGTAGTASRRMAWAQRRDDE